MNDSSAENACIEQMAHAIKAEDPLAECPPIDILKPESVSVLFENGFEKFEKCDFV